MCVRRSYNFNDRRFDKRVCALSLLLARQPDAREARKIL